MEVINGGGGRQQPTPEIPKGLITKIVIGAGVLLFVIFGLSMFYTVEEQEEAAVLTFGKFTETRNAGLHFKLPSPIQTIVKVPSIRTQRIHIGYRVAADGRETQVESESMMITGDENIVSADAVVEFVISDLQKYLFNISEPEKFLRNSASAAIRSVIGSTPLDYAITDGKTVIQGQVKEKLLELMEEYQTGIFVQDIKFQDIEPPSGEVQTAFRDVTNAREERNTKINNAKKYENDIIPKSRGEAQALLENATAMKASRVFNAQGDVAKFEAIYAEYVSNKEITESRLIIETLEKVLPKAKIIITDDTGDTVKYLPLNDLIRPSGTQGGAAR